MLKLKKPERKNIIVDYKGGKFIFKKVGALDSFDVGEAFRSGVSRNIAEVIFKLLKEVENIEDDEGDKIQPGMIINYLDEEQILTIATEFIEQFGKLNQGGKEAVKKSSRKRRAKKG